MISRTIKCVILGSQGSGKTSLIERYIHDDYDDDQKMTNGISHYYYTSMMDDTYHKIKVLDTTGNDRYKYLMPLYYYDSHVIVLVYDVTCQSSFDNIKNVFSLITKNMNRECSFIMVGNKMDNAHRVIDVSEAYEYAKNKNMSYIETSAKYKININELFITIFKQGYRIYSNNVGNSKYWNYDNIYIDNASISDDKYNDNVNDKYLGLCICNII